jgi:hypothetical protein
MHVIGNCPDINGYILRDQPIVTSLWWKLFIPMGRLSNAPTEASAVAKVWWLSSNVCEVGLEVFCVRIDKGS